MEPRPFRGGNKVYDAQRYLLIHQVAARFQDNLHGLLTIKGQKPKAVKHDRAKPLAQSFQVGQEILAQSQDYAVVGPLEVVLAGHGAVGIETL